MLICASEAEAPSPEHPEIPVPATVDIMPDEVTLRSRYLSPIYKLPERSQAIGPTLILAAVAAPPSPSNPTTPVPAKVEINPVIKSILLILLL
jgi:hypothetical protein